MSYDGANLKLLQNGTPQVWAYWTNDLLNAVTASAYFTDYAKFQKGDLILVAGDLDGTPFTTQLTVSSASGASTVTTTDLATATISFAERATVSVSVPAIGTASTKYVVSPCAGSVAYVAGAMDADGAGSGGTSTITISVPTTGAIATLPFLQGTLKGAVIEDTTITAHAALVAGSIITVATDGTGSHTGAAEVIIRITPS